MVLYVYGPRAYRNAVHRWGTDDDSWPGHVRHGLMKHGRDRRRARQKRLARLVVEGHDLERAPGTVCGVCLSPPNAEHVLQR